jgi:SAM-dependent methyltransferase
MKPELYAEPIVVSDISECYFYHTTDLPDFGVQRGQWDLRGSFEEYVGRTSFAGKRVLDVGCASGFLSFCAERLGAREVVSFDMDDSKRQHWLPFHNKLHYTDPAKFQAEHNKWIQKWRNAYWLTHRLSGSRAKVIYGDVYDMPQAAGQFDVVLVCSILEHLSDPIWALASIARVAYSELVITAPVIESDDKIAEFRGDAERPDLDYTWWFYSIGIYRQVLKMLGFEIDRITKGRYKFELANRLVEQTTIVARRA